jgi:ABC-type uncharacterized transport system permease subunit
MGITMLYIITSLGALILYICATSYLFTLLVQRQSLQQPWLFAMISSGLALHAAGIYHLMITSAGIDLSITRAFSLVTVTINTIVMISSLKKPLHNLFVLLLPLSIAAVLLTLIDNKGPLFLPSMNFGIGLHVVLSIVSYSLLAVATLQALLLHWQNSHLKNRQITGFIRHLPPLQTMEALVFELLWVGVILLAAAIGLGALYIENMFAQHLVHKTVLSLIALGVFTILLYGRVRWGWRGNRATRWVLTGFCMLMLAYFGSKLVLEVILK